MDRTEYAEDFAQSDMATLLKDALAFDTRYRTSCMANSSHLCRPKTGRGMTKAPGTKVLALGTLSQTLQTPD